MNTTRGKDMEKGEIGGLRIPPDTKRMKLYQLLFRTKLQADSGYIEASSMEKAIELGRDWCIRNDKRYINVRDAVLVRESD